ncbi:hypothetical protein RUM44_003337 [Polyplax serrata]|uniref:Kinesin-like protein n=1 Tax=Polyplax serrata TaxID=468196 RepID=A0ABR1AG83_POLSC
MALSKKMEKRTDTVFKTPTSCNSKMQKSTPGVVNTTSRVNTPKNSNISKSKSTPIISEKYMNLMKIRDKGIATPVTHLCSPSLSPKGRRHFIQNNNCSVKRFLSDSSLNEVFASHTGDNATPNSQQQEEEASNFVVGVRVRPFNLRELSDPTVRNVVQMTDDNVVVTCDRGAIHSFSYDHCFWSFDSTHPQYASQETVFATMVLPLMDQVFMGCNACLLAYGQTGSGKSYSMMGLDSGVQGELGSDSGVIPRFFEEVFRRISDIEKHNDSCLVEISYFEIYNEKIHDLLGTHSNFSLRKSLKVREHPTFGPYVVDLSAHSVKSFQDVQDWITVGNSQRVTAATGMNEKSSRSHSIFSVTIIQKGKSHGLHGSRSKVNLVDLAGSERVAQMCATGTKLKEGVSINKSLLSLGKVITFLAEKGKKKGTTSFGPYRESVLTWLLRESLGGNSRTAMLATISPANVHLDETLATLRYACQARSIVNRVYKNEDANERMIRELRAEVEKITMLRQELDRMKKMVEYAESKEKEEEIERLKKRLVDSEDLLTKSQLSWTERLKEAESLKAAELQYLKRCGVAIGLQCDKKIPCLVNLAADPMLTGTLLYLLPPGRMVIGRSVDSSDSKAEKPDIGLNGPLIQPHHCEILNRDGRLYLIPVEGCDTYVNGQAIKEETELHHKWRVVFGGIHYFRVSIPTESEVSIEDPVDFDFAHEEILKVQEEKLRAELEESKQMAISKLEAEMESMLGAQKFDYERQINEMLSIVEMQTNALAEERKQKHFLQMERNVLQERVNNHDSCRKNMNDGQRIAKKCSPYKSTFLQDLKVILEDTTLDFVSDENSEAISLHEMQVLVKEATQRCREYDINYEFHQQQIFGANGLKPVVKVVDKSKFLFSLWKPQKFIKLINLLRESEQQSEIEKLLKDSTKNWEAQEVEAKEKRISVNTDYFKKQLSQNIKNAKDNSFIEGEKVPEKVTVCLQEMRAKADNLINFCFNEESPCGLWRNRVKHAMKHFEMFFSVVQGDSLPADKNGKCVRFSETS